jgi:hypothetical protein
MMNGADTAPPASTRANNPAAANRAKRSELARRQWASGESRSRAAAVSQGGSCESAWAAGSGFWEFALAIGAGTGMAGSTSTSVASSI